MHLIMDFYRAEFFIFKKTMRPIDRFPDPDRAVELHSQPEIS
jgi:hypothetical protein